MKRPGPSLQTLGLVALVGMAQLQRRLAGLSTSSMTIQAERSSHYIMLDRPDLVIAAVRRVLVASRGNTRLR